VGRITSRQLRQLADLATHYGKSEIRLTVWQSIIVPDVPDAFAATVQRNLTRFGFFTEASLATGGIIACTGNQGCKYSAAKTKGHAIALMKHLGNRVQLESPVN